MFDFRLLASFEIDLYQYKKLKIVIKRDELSLSLLSSVDMTSFTSHSTHQIKYLLESEETSHFLDM